MIVNVLNETILLKVLPVKRVPALFQLMGFNGLEILLFSVAVVLIIIIACLAMHNQKPKTNDCVMHNEKPMTNDIEVIVDPKSIVRPEEQLLKIYEHAVCLYNNKNYSTSLVIFQDLERSNFNVYNKRSMMYYYMALSLEKLDCEQKIVLKCFEKAVQIAENSGQIDIIPIINKEIERINRMRRIH